MKHLVNDIETEAQPNGRGRGRTVGYYIRTEGAEK